MDGKQYFIDQCNSHGINPEKYFKLGTGKKYKQNRYEYRCPYESRNETQIFAIKYFVDEGLYLAWNLRNPKAKGKSVFSLSKKSREIEISTSSITQISKDIEYSGRGEEIVYKFYPQAIDSFLQLFMPVEL